MRRLYLILLVPAALFGCSSGKSAFEHGQYYSAVMQSVQRLRQNPDHKKSQEALRQAYPLAVEYYETEVRNALNSNSSFKYKTAMESYQAINSMYESIRQSPGAMRVIGSPKNYYNEVGEMRDKAAAEVYDAGITALMKGNREDARKAYFHFVEANNLVNGYKESIEMMDKAKFEATLKVVVHQVSVPGRYNLSASFFQDQVESFLHSQYTDKDFVRFYTLAEAQTINLERADQSMRLAFEDFSVGNVHTVSKEETFTKDSVKVGETTVKGEKLPVYGKVSAKLFTYRKEVTSNGVLSMTVLDSRTGGVLSTRKFTGQYVWATTWGNFNGDDRALEKEQLDMCKRRETNPPPAQDLFLEFTKPIYNQLTPAIRSFYQPYR
jgi:hypothetical protein